MQDCYVIRESAILCSPAYHLSAAYTVYIYIYIFIYICAYIYIYIYMCMPVRVGCRPVESRQYRSAQGVQRTRKKNICHHVADLWTVVNTGQHRGSKEQKKWYLPTCCRPVDSSQHRSTQGVQRRKNNDICQHDWFERSPPDIVRER